MWRREVRVTAEQRAELEWMVRHDPKPYRRERAAAILQVADGRAAHAVAASGMLVRRAADTVYRWLDRFDELGVAGLTMAAGRGRKPAHFPPSAS
ncbi:MAG: helix-turn-helix domain-containing protein [Chloroflexota bacterium]